MHMLEVEAFAVYKRQVKNVFAFVFVKMTPHIGWPVNVLHIIKLKLKTPSLVDENYRSFQ